MGGSTGFLNFFYILKNVRMLNTH